MPFLASSRVRLEEFITSRNMPCASASFAAVALFSSAVAFSSARACLYALMVSCSSRTFLTACPVSAFSMILVSVVAIVYISLK